MKQNQELLEFEGIYGVGIPGATRDAVKQMEIYSKRKDDYRLTTTDTIDLRKIVQTAGSVRESLMQEQSAGSYSDLGAGAKSALQEAYKEANDDINELIGGKIIGLVEGLSTKGIDFPTAAGHMAEYGDTITGVLKFAKRDSGVPEFEAENLDVCSSRFLTVEPPIIDAFYIRSRASKSGLEIDRNKVNTMVTQYNDATNAKRFQLKERSA